MNTTLTSPPSNGTSSVVNRGGIALFFLLLLSPFSLFASPSSKVKNVLKKTMKYYRKKGAFNPKKAWPIHYEISCLVTEWGWWGGNYQGTLTMPGSTKPDWSRFYFTSNQHDTFSDGKETWLYDKKKNLLEKQEVGSVGNLAEFVINAFLPILYGNWTDTIDQIERSPSSQESQYDILEAESFKDHCLKRIVINHQTGAMITYDHLYYNTYNSSTFAGYYKLRVLSFEVLGALPKDYFSFNSKKYPEAEIVNW